MRGDVYLLTNFRFTYFKYPWNIFYIYLEDRDTRIMSAGIKLEEKWKRIMLENIVSLCYLRNILLLHLYILLTEVKRYFLTLHCLRLLLNEKNHIVFAKEVSFCTMYRGKDISTWCQIKFCFVYGLSNCYIVRFETRLDFIT